MKILTLSDTHSKHKKIPQEWLPEADCVIHSGDISSMGHIAEIKSFLEWFNSLNYKYKIFIAGNHDWGFQEQKNKVLELLKSFPDIIYLEHESIEIEGFKIFGSPYQPTFYNWAFNIERGQDILKKWNDIPFDTDILITHGPVYSILDIVPNGESVGCVDLFNTINDRLLNLKLYVCGHIHCSSGYAKNNDIMFVNASILNEQYTIQYKPKLVEWIDNEFKIIEY